MVKIRKKAIESENETNDPEGHGIENIIFPSNILSIYTRLEVLLGLKLSGHTDTLTEARNLVDEYYERGVIQNENQYVKALGNFHTNWRFEKPSFSLNTINGASQKLLQHIAFNTRSKIGEPMLIVMDNFTHENHLSQTLQAKKKQFKWLFFERDNMNFSKLQP